MRQNPNADAQLYARAVQLFESGRYSEAARHAEQILKRRPGHAQTLLLRASALARAERPAEARRILERLLRLDPSHHHLHHEIALTHLNEGNLGPAHASIDRALAVEPRNPLYAAAKAELHQIADESAEGVAVLEPFIEAGESDARCRVVFAELCSDVGRSDDAEAALEPVLASASALVPPLERRARFALAAVLDRADRHEEAIDAATEANRRADELRGGRFDADAHELAIDAMIANWDRAAIERLVGDDRDPELPVFIVGMPRSGTSLLEQILASHPAAFGAGELGLVPGFVGDIWPARSPALSLATNPADLTKAQVRRFARSTLQQLRQLGGNTARVSDKNPLNFLHLGPIALAFPGCRVVHCRRDPLDTCVSCYMHDFKGDFRFTNDLGTLGRFYRQYERLMAHWRETLPLQILDLEYESVVNDFDVTARCMIEFLELPWHNACERFHETERLTQTASRQQVRRPLFATAVGRAARYGDRLQPLRDALGGA